MTMQIIDGKQNFDQFLRQVDNMRQELKRKVDHLIKLVQDCRDTLFELRSKPTSKGLVGKLVAYSLPEKAPLTIVTHAKTLASM